MAGPEPWAGEKWLYNNVLKPAAGHIYRSFGGDGGHYKLNPDGSKRPLGSDPSTAKKSKGQVYGGLPSDYKATEQKAGQAAEKHRKGAGFTPGDPSLIPPAGNLDTTSTQTNYSTRSHNEEYVQKVSQWGDNDDIRKAADKGFDVGQTYRAGNPLQETPAYIRAGSEEYMNRPDMDLWAQSNPAAAEALQEKGTRREARIAAHEKRMAGLGAAHYPGMGEDRKYKAGGESIQTAGAPGEWKSQRLGDMVAAVQQGIMKTRGGVDPRSTAATDNVRQRTKSIENSGFSPTDAETMGMSSEQAMAIAGGGSVETIFDGGEVAESRIIEATDQNPGVTREEAKRLAQAAGASAARVARVGQSGVSDVAMDHVMEASGMKRNQAVDMIRSEEPMAHLEMGKRFTEPGSNRVKTFIGNERTHREQAQYTGTLGNSKMQPQSGLGEARTQKAPLKYEQGNVHARSDADTQETNDHISADRFAWEVNNNIGKQMFGQDYNPLRSMPQY